MGKRDGKVLEIHWHRDATPPVYIVLGHIEYEKALETLLLHYNKPVLTLDIASDGGRHRYARWVQPSRLLKEEGAPRQIHLQDAPARGLFPVTVFPTKEAADRWL